MRRKASVELLATVGIDFQLIGDQARQATIPGALAGPPSALHPNSSQLRLLLVSRCCGDPQLAVSLPAGTGSARDAQAVTESQFLARLIASRPRPVVALPDREPGSEGQPQVTGGVENDRDDREAEATANKPRRRGVPGLE